MSSAVPHRIRTPRPARLAGYADRVGLTVVPRRRTRAPRVPFVTLVTMVLVGGVVGLLLFNTSMQQASFASTRLEQQATALGLREQTLQLQLQRMRDPQRLGEHAESLGMELAAGSAVFLNLGTGEVSGARGEAAPSPRVRIRPYPARRPDSLVPATVVVRALTRGTPPAAGGAVPRTGDSTTDTAAGSPGTGASTGRNE